MFKLVLNIFVIVCVLIFAITAPAAAKTIYVNPNGSADFTSIQEAIDDPCTVDSDEIEVAPGTYYEVIDFKGKAVRLYSSGGRDVTTIHGNWNNFNVVKCVSGEDANTILEGFTITGGNANMPISQYPQTYSSGAGMCNEYSSPTVKDCIFTWNFAFSGGGMCNYDANTTVTGCTFSNNPAALGGGMSNLLSSPTVTNCTFTGNSTTGAGGGMVNLASNPTVTNCTFTDNSTAMEGGGMYNDFNSSPTVTNCTFTDNDANNGGGMYNKDSIPTVANCILWGNTAAVDGNEIAQLNGSTMDVNYCDVKGGQADIYNDGSGTVNWGPGNIDADPLFVNAAGGDLRLASGSPCIDAGDNTAVPASVNTDLDGLMRYVDDPDTFDTGYAGMTGKAVIDMGAYEYQGPQNTTPVACIVGGDRVVEAGDDCEGRVVLDGSCSSDADSTAGTNDDINDFDWYEVIDVFNPNSYIYIGSGEVIECNIGLGEHLIILEVTDKAGAFDVNGVSIVVEDRIPPEFSLSVKPNVLWPPNNKMILVTPSWEVSDNCDESPEVSLVDVKMSPAGNLNDHIQIGGDGSVYLRARKSKGRAMRIYTLTYQAVDDSGNVVIESATVVVPHSQR